jgi:hypothetical protein
MDINELRNTLYEKLNTIGVDPFFVNNRIFVFFYIIQKCERYIENEKYHMEIAVAANSDIIIDISTVETVGKAA